MIHGTQQASNRCFFSFEFTPAVSIFVSRACFLCPVFEFLGVLLREGKTFRGNPTPGISGERAEPRGKKGGQA